MRDQRRIIRARRLRRDSTDCERILWDRLRRRSLDGIKFRRQHPLGPYVLDFFCEEARVGIELDGGGHDEDEQRLRDARKARHAEERGIRILRFWNTDVLQNVDGVLETILRAVRPPSP
jgi:very-short-patch-repair endonuclease